MRGLAAHAEHHLRRGLKVGIVLPMRGEIESRGDPPGAILGEIYGGVSVDEKLGEHVLARRWVVIQSGSRARSDPGIGAKAGTAVGNDGAAELFGTEFAGASDPSRPPLVAG